MNQLIKVELKWTMESFWKAWEMWFHKPCAGTTFSNFAKGKERKKRNSLLAFFDDGYRCCRSLVPALQRWEYKHIRMKWIVVLDTCRLLLRLVRRAYPQRDETPFCCPRHSKLLADNGPQFARREFKSFASEWGLEHSTSSSYCPQSNGTYLGNARWFWPLACVIYVFLVAKELLTSKELNSRQVSSL